jgi:hypothetical protein
MQEINTKLLDILFLKFKKNKIEYRYGNEQYAIVEFDSIKNFTFTKTICNTDIDHLAFNRRKEITIKDETCIHPLNLFLLSRLFI